MIATDEIVGACEWANVALVLTTSADAIGLCDDVPLLLSGGTATHGTRQLEAQVSRLSAPRTRSPGAQSTFFAMTAASGTSAFDVNVLTFDGNQWAHEFFVHVDGSYASLALLSAATSESAAFYTPIADPGHVAAERVYFY